MQKVEVWINFALLMYSRKLGRIGRKVFTPEQIENKSSGKNGSDYIYYGK